MTARRSGVEPGAVSAFFEMWSGTERVVTLYSQGVNQSAQGTDKVAAILNCHLATGPLGRAGMRPFSLTGQPNAMGGREVGGEPAGEARPDWWAVCEVARRMGFAAAFAFDGPAAIFREHAALSAFENHGARDFDIGGLSLLNDAAYDRFAPVQWPAPAGAPGGQARMFADGRLFTPSGRAQFVAIAPPVLAASPGGDFPFLLNTGRIRDQWHTMTRTGLSARLGAHLPDPFLEVNPEDAQALGLADGGFARVTTPQGAAVLRVAVTGAQTRGRLFAPIHSVVDPFSGQPDSKAVPARIGSANFAAYGFILARRRLRLPGDAAWGWSAIEGGFVARFATNENFASLLESAEAAAPNAERVIYRDPARGVFRAALIAEGRIAAVLFMGREGEVPAWSVLAAAWRSERLDTAARHLLLAGKAASRDFDSSPTICACFGVKSRAIETAIAAGADTTQAIGARLHAGTNCGSCLPELRKMILAAIPG
jgi:assimilatory nitrate reductase catalytic subunit